MPQPPGWVFSHPMPCLLSSLASGCLAQLRYSISLFTHIIHVPAVICKPILIKSRIFYIISFSLPQPKRPHSPFYGLIKRRFQFFAGGGQLPWDVDSLGAVGGALSAANTLAGACGGLSHDGTLEVVPPAGAFPL